MKPSVWTISCVASVACVARGAWVATMGDEACTALLNNEDAVTKQILQDTEERLKHDDMISIEDPDHLQLELDLTVKESPLVNGLLTLVSVATFLAGFVASDFSGYQSEDWQGAHWISKWLYVCLLAYAEGSCLYIAICGTMACATHLRAANQLEGWENRCRIALEPVLQNLDQVKGKRLDTIEAVLRAVVHSQGDWARTLAIAGGINMSKMVHWYQKPGADGSGQFLLIIKDPVSLMGSHCAFKYLTDVSFPIAIVCFLSAQTLKALKGESQHIVLSVLIIVAFWLLKIGHDLQSLYRKILDWGWGVAIELPFLHGLQADYLHRLSAKVSNSCIVLEYFHCLRVNFPVCLVDFCNIPIVFRYSLVGHD